ncbi:hypothetical protein CPB86DRAFT_782884 [Serendipita vermifera]|nr:hypothetical protein CPB86DRAFT_782884 [Serendipita vermifera]
MEFWPTDHRSNIKKGKGRDNKTTSRHIGNEKHDGVGITPLGPVLSPANGSVGAATLRPSLSGGLEWDTITRSGRIKLVPSSCRELYPGRAINKARIPQLSDHRRAEEGVKYLRQRFPDVDIPFEIIKEQIEEDRKYRNLYEMESSATNCLAVLCPPSATIQDRRDVFAFPMGSLGNELNLSSLTWSRTQGVVFDAATSPATTFDTPICQIESSMRTITTDEALQEDPTCFIRTMSFCAIFSIHSPSKRSALKLQGLGTVKNVEGSPIVYAAASPYSYHRGILVNENGLVALLRLDEDRSSVSPVGGQSDVSSAFWRTCWTSNQAVMLHTDRTRMNVLDTRDGIARKALQFGNGELVTGFEGYQGHKGADIHRILITTTKRLVYADDRYLRYPVLSWEHMRSHDLTLHTMTHPTGSYLLTYLMSQKNGLISVYDFSSDDGLVHSNGVPSVLQTATGDFKRMGTNFYRHPASVSQDFEIVELSSEGGIFATNVAVSPFTENAIGDTMDDEVINLDPSHRGIVSKHSIDRISTFVPSKPVLEVPMSTRASIEVDLEKVYEGVLHQATSHQQKDVTLDDVHGALERMPRVWQETDYSIETVLTTYDVALLASAEPPETTRSAFHMDTPLHSQRGLLAFREGYLPSRHTIAGEEIWSYDIKPVINAIASRSHVKNIGPVSVLPTDSLAVRDAKREMEMDLTLSSHIYAPAMKTRQNKNSFSANEEDAFLERATQGMSLTETREPPPLKCSFLIPRPEPEDQAGMEAGRTKQYHTLGVLEDAPFETRLLLSEWNLGEDPSLYEYRDGGSGRRTSTPEVLSSLQNPPLRQSSVPAQRSQPPVIAITTHTKVGPVGPAMSQPITVGPSRLESYDTPNQIISPALPLQASQPPRPTEIGMSQGAPISSTQVLPGKHGGRPKVASKKPKARMGGF